MGDREKRGRGPRAEYRGPNAEGSAKLSLRLARPAEATAIANLSRDLIEVGLQWRWTPARVASSIRAPHVNVLVACMHDRVVGFGIMRYGDEAAHLDLLAVAPLWRREGVGRLLLEWLEKCAIVAGISAIALEVREGNEGAQLFYERMGYRALARAPGYYQGIEAALRMGRDLPRPFLGPELLAIQREALEKIFGVPSDPIWQR